MSKLKRRESEDENEKIAMDLFGRTLKIAHEKNICISCGKVIKKKDFYNSDVMTKRKALDEYEEYGFCQKCNELTC